MKERELYDVLFDALTKLDRDGEIVFFPRDMHYVARILYATMERMFPVSRFSSVELAAMRQLILLAVEDKEFFDWEMSTLTGLSAEEFRQLALRLPGV